MLGLNIQHVRGYRGAADVFLAQQRNELDGQVVGLASIKVGQPALWQAGAFRPLIMFGRTTRFGEFPDVPTGRELTKDPKALRLLDFAEAPFFMALPLVAPPGLPADRAAALQAGFMAMTRDPAFIAEAQKMSLELSPDRRRGGAQGDRADAGDAAGGDRAVQGDRRREELGSRAGAPPRIRTRRASTAARPNQVSA